MSIGIRRKTGVRSCPECQGEMEVFPEEMKGMWHRMCLKCFKSFEYTDGELTGIPRRLPGGDQTMVSVPSGCLAVFDEVSA